MFTFGISSDVFGQPDGGERQVAGDQRHHVQGYSLWLRAVGLHCNYTWGTIIFHISNY